MATLAEGEPDLLMVVRHDERRVRLFIESGLVGEFSPMEVAAACATPEAWSAFWLEYGPWILAARETL